MSGDLKMSDSARAAAIRGPFLVDAHVHFHRCFEERTFLELAARKFCAAASDLEMAPELTGILLLAESAGVDWFSEVGSSVGSEFADGWKVTGTEESFSLFLNRGDRSLLLVAGYQIKTMERIEVLALGTESRVVDELPFPRTVGEVFRVGATPVVPWGFGKWLPPRGSIVREAIAADEYQGLILGDIHGRPIPSRQPSLFRLAARMGVPILAGSDPLALPADVARVGSYGSVVEGRIDPLRPMESLRLAWRQSQAGFSTFGRRQRIMPFISRQIRLRTRGRLT
jgi:hypothetical protein